MKVAGCAATATNDSGCYADQNADNPEWVLHGFLLCDSGSLIDPQNRVDGIAADFPSPAALAQDIRIKLASV